MHRLLSVLILVAAVALYAAGDSAGGTTGLRPPFFGDGFDNATCADAPHAHGC